MALEQVEGLENIADGLGPEPVALGLAEVHPFASLQHDGAAVGSENAGNQIKESRFPGTTLAAQRQLGSRRQRKFPHLHHA